MDIKCGDTIVWEEHTGTVIGLGEWEVFVNEFHGRITQEVEVSLTKITKVNGIEY